MNCAICGEEKASLRVCVDGIRNGRCMLYVKAESW